MVKGTLKGTEMSPMKIVTVNVSEADIEVIETLVNKNGIYPSRSELIRVAVRDLLVREIKLLKHTIKAEVKDQLLKDIEIKIPNEKISENDEPVREFKTYKVVKVMDTTPNAPRESTRIYAKKGCLGNIYHPEAHYPAVFKEVVE